VTFARLIQAYSFFASYSYKKTSRNSEPFKLGFLITELRKRYRNFYLFNTISSYNLPLLFFAGTGGMNYPGNCLASISLSHKNSLNLRLTCHSKGFVFTLYTVYVWENNPPFIYSALIISIHGVCYYDNSFYCKV